MSNPILHPFPPVIASDSRILILGSFPSVRSREEGFFYGHPRNRFWPMLALVYEEAVPATIPDKRSLLLRHRLALWDVIASCEITGSSDASVRAETPVNIAGVMKAAPIEQVICNGALAGKLYRKHLQSITGIPARILPSTSPANAAWSLERLVKCWHDALKQG